MVRRPLYLRWLYAGAFTVWSLRRVDRGWPTVWRSDEGSDSSWRGRVDLPCLAETEFVTVLFSRKERGLPSGLFDFGTRSGLVLEGILVPWLLVRYGWRHTSSAVRFTGLLGLSLGFGFSPAACGRRIRRRLPFPLRLRRPNYLERRAVQRHAAERNLLGICLGFFCFDYYWYVLVTWLPDYLVTVRHLSVVQAGFYASLAFFTFGVAEPIGGWIADSLIRRGWDQPARGKGS